MSYSICTAIYLPEWLRNSNAAMCGYSASLQYHHAMHRGRVKRHTSENHLSTVMRAASKPVDLQQVRQPTKRPSRDCPVLGHTTVQSVCRGLSTFLDNGEGRTRVAAGEDVSPQQIGPRDGCRDQSQLSWQALYDTECVESENDVLGHH